MSRVFPISNRAQQNQVILGISESLDQEKLILDGMNATNTQYHPSRQNSDLTLARGFNRGRYQAPGRRREPPIHRLTIGNDC